MARAVLRNQVISWVVLLHGFVSSLPLVASAETPSGLNPSDWARLRELHRSGSLEIRPAGPHSFIANNAAQDWALRFDGLGFTASDLGTGIEWGLELRGLAGGLQSPRTKSLSTAADPRMPFVNRLEYQRGPGLTEWFVNGPAGLQQGWTLHSAPAELCMATAFPDVSGESGVSLSLSTRGGLLPQLEPGSRSVSFLGADGTARVSYSGLQAWDASFRPLPVRFESQEGDPSQIRIHLDVDSSTQYPVTIDPIARQAYLKASNPDAGDAFGTSVAISGDRVAVSAPNERSSATGVNGDPTDNSIPGAGAVYVFARTNGVWYQEAYLKAVNPGQGDAFGTKVAMSGDTIVVTAPLEDSNPEDPDPLHNESFTDSGAAYVYVREAGGWKFQDMLKAGKRSWLSLGFGSSVAIDGDVIVVGAPQDRNEGAGINPPFSTTPGGLLGAAYVFTRQAGKWSLHDFIRAPYDTSDGSFAFGRAVAVAGKNIFIAAPRDASTAQGINGSMTQFPTTTVSGAVMAYRLEPNGLVFDAYIKSSNSENADGFGFAVAASGDTMVASAVGEDSDAVGINGSQGNSTTKKDSGAVYVFDRTGSGWSQTAYVKAPATLASESFGISLAFENDVLAVGSRSTASGSEGSKNYKGTAYVYFRQSGAWQFQAIAKPVRSGDEGYALSIGISGGTLVAGAPSDSDAGVGVNQPAGPLRQSSGAAHLFTGLGPVVSAPVVIQFVNVLPQQLVIDFSSTPGVTTWKFFGGASISAVTQDLSAQAVVTEPTAGHYHAVIPSGSAEAYFIRIQP